MLKSFAHDLQERKLLSTDDRVVIAVSSGADSIALLHLFHRLNQNLGWNLTLHAAHLNHGLRGADSDADAAFVQALCDGLGVPCTINRREVAAIAAETSRGLEETGRNERFAFFQRVCLQTGSSIVALAHHADDQAETVLQRVIRGTGLRGLGGMPLIRPLTPGSAIRVIRPLLGMNRASIRQFLAQEGIAYREDRSNADIEPTRNRIRHGVMPILEDINPQARDALLRLAAQAEWFNQYFAETVHRTLETLTISRTDQALVLNADALSRKSRIIQTGLIREAYATFELGEQDLSFSHLVAVADLLDDPASGRQVQLPGGMTVEKRYHQLIFLMNIEESREFLAPQVSVRVPGRTVLPLRAMEIRCDVSEIKSSEINAIRRQGSRMLEHVDYDAVHPPLVIRPRRPGERFVPLGAPGSKKLSDYLTDAKVNPADRRNIAVLCDQLGPIWIVGHRIDDRVKLTPQTRRVLQLEARNLSP